MGGTFKRDPATIKKMADQLQDASLMDALKTVENGVVVATGKDNYAKIFQNLRLHNGCSACGTTPPNKKHLKVLPHFLDDYATFAKTFNAPGVNIVGVDKVLKQLRNGSTNQIDEVAQIVRYASEIPPKLKPNEIHAFDEVINQYAGGVEFDFKYKNASGNAIAKFDELKSYKADLGSITSSNPQLQPGGQFGGYLEAIQSLDNLKYKFDKRKLLNEHLGEGGFANITAAEIAIKAKFKKIMVGEPLPSTPTPTPAQIAANQAERIAIADNYVGVMSENLKTSLLIENGADLIQNQNIDSFLNSLIKVE